MPDQKATDDTQHPKPTCPKCGNQSSIRYVEANVYECSKCMTLIKFGEEQTSLASYLNV
jgi:ribosomal protein L37AE/L43A